MDYKYIEQLLEKYWNCETSLQEEQILRAFFSQEDIPVHLLRYKSLFTYQQVMQEVGLGKDFDERLLAQVERPVVKARCLTFRARVMPLFKAAAVMAFLFTIGSLVKQSVDGEMAEGMEVPGQEQTTTDPQVAYQPDSVKNLVDVAEKATAIDAGNHIRK